MSGQKLGPEGEAHAWSLLKKRGDKLVCRNYTCSVGELDIVSWHKGTLVFTEVRARSNQEFGSPAETVTRGKQAKVKRAANWYVAQTFRGKPLPPCRFDVVWIVAGNGKFVDSGIIEGAFY